ncbi:MAG: Short-chain dehydrogenase [Planctomycetaceae bacterium]|nr:Short-chain dehydrogenase [Planctomycetaceae bacterium]
MQVNLQNQVAVITGGAQGIGRAIVEQFLANGAAVAIVDIQEKVAQQTVIDLGGPSEKLLAFGGDVSDAPGMKRLADDVAARFGKITILVNNAGINTVKDRRPVHEYAMEDWQRILQVDLTGVFATSQAVVPHLLNAGGGRIVNISSVAGLVPLRLQSAFVAAKAGVINLTKSMALELGPQNILVNGVAPGSTLTAGTRALFYGADGSYSQNAASLISHIPLGRPGEPEEIAAAVLFLVAPEASYINGCIITVDGGWTAGYHREW